MTRAFDVFKGPRFAWAGPDLNYRSVERATSSSSLPAAPEDAHPLQPPARCVPPRPGNLSQQYRLAAETAAAFQEMMYPMFVVRVSDFMGMEQAFPHDDLMAKGLVDRFDSHMGEVAVFVSHQWCGTRHADPHFRQLRVLQQAFERMAAGSSRVYVDFFSFFGFNMKTAVRPSDLRGVMTWWMWLDYFSVPQPPPHKVEDRLYRDTKTDLGRAVASLPAYVAVCQVFFVLAPTVLHEDGRVLDYTSWKSRGWCRLERFARMMSEWRKPMVLVKSSAVFFQLGNQDCLLDSVSLGFFSDESDRARVAELASQLYARRVQRFLQAGDLYAYRRLTAAQDGILDTSASTKFWGTTAAHPPCGDGDAGAAFMRLMRLGSPVRQADGTDPILLAACMGDVRVLRDLLDSRANIHCREAKDDPQFVVHRARHAIHCASLYGHADAVEFLLDARACVNARDGEGATPLHAATAIKKKEKHQVVTLLLERRVDLEARSVLGSTALEYCVMFSFPELASQLIAAGASVRSGPDGIGPLHYVALFGAGMEVGRVLLEARASVHDTVRARPMSKVDLVTRAGAMAYYFGDRSLMSTVCYHVKGSSPLAWAVMCGNLAEAQLMLNWRADPSQRNARGADILELCRLGGTLQDDVHWLLTT